MNAHRVLAAIAGVLCLAAPPNASASTSVTAAYVLGAPDVVAAGTVAWIANVELGVTCVPSERGPHVGGVCVDLVSGAVSVEVAIHDATHRRVSGTLSYVDRAGGRVGASIRFCDRHRGEVPPGAAGLVVAVESTVIRCGPVRGGPATAGRVSVDMHQATAP